MEEVDMKDPKIPDESITSGINGDPHSQKHL